MEAAASSPGTPLPEEQRVLIDAALSKGWQGEWCLINVAWWSQWQGWAKSRRSVIMSQSASAKGRSNTSAEDCDVPCPGAIDNRVLMRSSEELQTGLVWRLDYEVVPSPAWELLASWYGGGPRLSFPVTPGGRVALERATKPSTTEKMFQCGACFAPIESSGAVGCGRCLSVAYCDRSCQRSAWRFHRPYCVERKEDPCSSEGEMIVPPPWRNTRSGLDNCGNTCFLNATVQCVRQARPLSRYFLNDSFKKDVNEANPLGTGGRLVREYAATLQRLELSRDRSVAPTALIRAIVRKNPDLGGRTQHDAHELLETLMDGLHEDLNRPRRTTRKIPVVVPDDDEDDDKGSSAEAEDESAFYGDDAKVAATSWANHLARNSSAVASFTHGLLRSTLECPECETRRARFDPFGTLQLELNLASSLDKDDEDLDDPSALSSSDVEDEEEDRAPKRRLREKAMLIAEEGGSCAWAPQIPLPDADSALLTLRVAAAAALKTNPESVRLYDLVHDEAGFAPPRKLSSSSSASSLPLAYYEDEFDDPQFSRTLIAVCAPPRDFRLGIVRHIVEDGRVLDNVSVATLAVGWSQDRAKVSAWRAAKRLVDIESRGDANPPDPRKAAVTEFRSAERNNRSRRRTEAPISKFANNVYVEEGDDEEVDEVAIFPLAGGEEEDLSSLYTVDWSSTSEALERTITVKASKAQVPPLNEILAASFVECAASTYKASSEAERWMRRRTRRSLERAWREADEAARITPTNFDGDLLGGGPSVRMLRRQQEPLTLEGCLRRFTAVEKLDAENSWYCTTCATSRRARKRIAIWRSPDVLIFTLKRFSPLHGRKLDRFVDFPLEGLDMAQFCCHSRRRPGSQDYTLFGVVNHFGSAGYGHYTAYTRDLWNDDDDDDRAAKRRQWYLFDDSDATPVEPSAVCSNAAYVLFYSRDASRHEDS